jgi:hypothetical protein
MTLFFHGAFHCSAAIMERVGQPTGERPPITHTAQREPPLNSTKGNTLIVLIIALLAPLAAVQAATEERATIKFTTGSEADLQALLDKAPAGAVVVCEQTKPLEISTTLLLSKPMTVRGLKARLQAKVDMTPILVADAAGITLTDIEMQGNFDSVSQQHRAPLIHLKRGGFRIEHCRFCDGSKDGIMITPERGTGDIVGGTIRDIEGARMGRDLVSLSGGDATRRKSTVQELRPT